MDHARVLVLEDDPGWQNTLVEILNPHVEHIATAATLTEALDLVARRYFNVAIVDLSLRIGDPEDIQGLDFLRQLRERKLDDALHCIVVSAYGSIRRVRDLFKDYDIVDFLDKGAFTAKDLLTSVNQALAANHLDHDLDIQIANEGDLSSLWERFAWARREDPFQLRPEMYDLLRRLFPGAHGLFVRDLPTGQSGAGVMQVEPHYGHGVGSPVVVKFGKKEKIAQERDNYEQHVQQFASAYSSTQLRCALGRVMGAICYHLIGTELNAVVSFAQYYRQHDPDAISNALDQLFHHTCGRWYDNRDAPKRARDLIALYKAGLHMDWKAVWAGAAETGVDLSAEVIEFPGLAGRFINPKTWLDRHAPEAYISSWLAVTHGDLNEHNVLVTEEGRCWLVDFYRTGPGHILRDALELETAIKFNLAGISDLAEYHRFERRLLEQTRLDQPVAVGVRHALYKPFAAIGYLRKLADPLAGNNNEMMDYFWGLLLTTLNLLGLEFMREHRKRVLLSAAMVCERLSAQH